ncbi:MAG: two-component system response regulator AtoC [Myxococcota bacterium]|jgi:two-component system response regulator AtoC
MSQPPLRLPPLEFTNFHGILTVSSQMREFFETLRRVARTEATVLIRGESGTGKELVASAVHACSPRSAKPFRAINCATLTSELLASELFGHVRGAFTGAVRDRTGLFRLADGGSVFLDEIAELPLDIQARLLRVLQERCFVPMGGSDSISVDIRMISATNKALRTEVEHRRFREDLMYRVRVVTLYLPALVERQGDIEALTWHFIGLFNQQGYRHVNAIAADAMDAMLAYPWPGNVRELQNNIEMAFAVGEGPVLMLDDLARELRGLAPPRSRDQGAVTAEDLERAQLAEALRLSRGRKSDAAEHLGISRSTLWRKLKLHGITP